MTALSESPTGRATAAEPTPEPWTGRRGRRPVNTSLRDALAVIGGLLGALIIVEMAVPTITTFETASLLDAVAVVAFAATGLIAWHRRPHNLMGRLLLLAGVSLLVAGMSDDDVTLLRTVGLALGSLPLAVLLHALIAFPSGRLTTPATRVVVGFVYVVAIAFQIPQQLVSAEAATVIWTVQGILGLTGMVASFVLAGRRLRAAPPGIRRELAPFLGYGCLAIVLIAAAIAVLHARPDPTTEYAVAVIEVAVISGLPFAFLIGMLAGSFGRAGEAEEVAYGLAEASADPHLLDDLVGRALGDRSARVLWAGDEPVGGWIDSDGSPVPGRAQAPGWWPVGPPAKPIGGLSYDPVRVADAGLVALVSAPLELAIANRRLVVDLRSVVLQLDEAAEQVRVSRRRIVSASDTERRRIARDLHDGVQQLVVAAGIDAQRIVRRAADPDYVRTAADRLSEQLRQLLDQLRALVHGIMPTTLQDRGLLAGVRALGDQVPIPVQVAVAGPLDRMAAEVESTGYFVVAEALANVLKHAAASRVSIGLSVANDRLVVTVADDGIGFSDRQDGFGLRSLRDRVAALDGTISLRSGPDGGTTLRAEFSCA